MGIIEASKGGLGLEASGIVHKVGAGVQGFAVGDRVVVFRSGCFSSRMHVSSLLCAKIPNDLSDEDAATVPTVYSTVIHSLMNLGNLQKGQVSQPCSSLGLWLIDRLFLYIRPVEEWAWQRFSFARLWAQK
jgi:Alcohol dehydrogenase GroES-like domain